MSAFLYIRVCPDLSFATKRIRPSCCTLFTLVTCYPLQFILSQNYLSHSSLVLAEKTLLKTAYHYLLLLVGFDTLTYRKDYDRSPILVGHHSNQTYNCHNSWNWSTKSLSSPSLLVLFPQPFHFLINVLCTCSYLFEDFD